MDKKKDIHGYLKALADDLFTQEAVEETDVKKYEAGEETEGLTLIDARNGFNEISRLAMLWTVMHH